MRFAHLTEGGLYWVTGDTYQVRDRLAAHGGKWHSSRRAWLVPESALAEVECTIIGDTFAPNFSSLCHSLSGLGMIDGTTCTIEIFTEFEFRCYESWDTGIRVNLYDGVSRRIPKFVAVEKIGNREAAFDRALEAIRIHNEK